MKRRFRAVFEAYKWWLYLALVLAVWCVGIVGYAHDPRVGRDEFFLPDAAYESFGLFFLHFAGLPLGPHDAWLHVARVVAPMVAALVALGALAMLNVDRFRQFRAQVFYRDHVVVCGLGDMGFSLVTEFRRIGQPVVAVDERSDHPLFDAAREAGAVVLQGDARKPLTLARAGVARARFLIAVCGEDDVNAEVALQAQELVRGAGRALTIALHVTNPRLCLLLKDQELRGAGAENVRLEFFNVFTHGARALLREHPPFRADPPTSDPPPIVVLGLGEYGENVLTAAARTWSRTGRAERLPVWGVDSDAARKLDAIHRRTPALERYVQTTPLELDRATLRFDPSCFGAESPAVAYVCLGSDSLSLAGALALSRVPGAENLPIVVSLTRDAGLAHLLETAGGDFRELYGFGLLDRTCTPELVLGGTHEILARAIHQEYRHFRLAEGADPSDASLRPWDELPESLRESNRRQADHIHDKLAAIGCGVVPLEDWDAPLFAFEPDEVETLSIMEHARWVEERRRAGWRQGSRKDVERKITPYLVPWDELSEEIKDLDRNAVREIPAVLARTDLGIYRRAMAPFRGAAAAPPAA